MTALSVTSGRHSQSDILFFVLVFPAFVTTPLIPLHLLRFCVVIRKENYPDQQPAKKVSGSAKQIYRQPGHTIYLLPTMVLANLLPCEINFYIKGTSIKGSLKPGKEAVLHAADTSQNMELGQDYLFSKHFPCFLLLVLMMCVLQESCWRTLPYAKSC